MNKLILPALLLAAPLAFAQAQTQAQPQPQPQTPASLTLTAPIGTAAEYSLTNRVSAKMSAPSAEAIPGQQVDQQMLSTLRQQMQAGSSETLPTQTMTDRVFYKVTGRDAAGTTLLVTSNITDPQTKKINVVRTTQRVTPTGKTEVLKMESDDPQMQKMFAALTAETLRQMNDQPGAGQNRYGAALTPGKAQTQTVSINMQNMLGGMLGSLSSGPGGEQVLGKVQSTPLWATVSTIYGGLNAQGQHVFNISSSYQPWKVRIEGKGDAPTMQLEVLSGSMSGQETYRRDGLPATSILKQTMKMKLTTEMQGIRIQMVMDMVQDTSLQPK